MENKSTETDEEPIVASSYSIKGDFSKGEVVKQDIQKVFEIRSKEMVPGYYNTATNLKTGEESKVWVPDSRKAFISSVKALYSILYPECQNDKEMKAFLIECAEKEKEIIEKYAYKERFHGRNENGRRVCLPTGKSYIPDIDFMFPIILNGSEGPKDGWIKGYWNGRVTLYWEETVDLYDTLFQELNALCFRLDFFKPTSGWG